MNQAQSSRDPQLQRPPVAAGTPALLRPNVPVALPSPQAVTAQLIDMLRRVEPVVFSSGSAATHADLVRLLDRVGYAVGPTAVR